jgi:hypothetical protein
MVAFTEVLVVAICFVVMCEAVWDTEHINKLNTRRPALHSSKQLPHDVVHSSKQLPHEAVHSSKQLSREVVHSSKQLPHEAVHSSKQLSREVVHSSKQLPRELVHSSKQLPHEVVHSSRQLPHEVVHSSKQLPHEVVVFATGYDGPIDNGDDWRYFDLNRTTLVVSMGGGVPSDLVTAAHAHGSRVSRAAVLDVDVSDASAVELWVDAEVAAVAASHADGVTIVRITQSHPTHARAVTVAVARLRDRLAPGAHLSVVLPLNLTRAGHDRNDGIDRAALASLVDFIVLAGTLDPQLHLPCATNDQGFPTTPEPNVPLSALAGAATASGIPSDKVVVALPWFGWDYRLSGCSSDPTTTMSSCGSVTPPSGTRACWRGWNLQRSVAYIEGTLAALPGAAFHVDRNTATGVLRYNDSTGAPHVVSYDTPKTLEAKYAACRGFRGVGIWTADMVSYVGDPPAQALAAAMWKSIDAANPKLAGRKVDGSTQDNGVVHHAPTDTAHTTVARRGVDVSTRDSDPTLTRAHTPSLPSYSTLPLHQSLRRVDRLAARFRRRHGLDARELIPGYNPCRRKAPLLPSGEGGGCSDGLLCISPEPTPGTAEHESGGCYPVRPGLTSFVARTRVPPIPPTFRFEQATVYYYLNLVMPDDGNSDVTNSTKGCVIFSLPFCKQCVRPCVRTCGTTVGFVNSHLTQTMTRT